MRHRIKDKVQVKAGGFTGQRGLIEKVAGTRLRVRLGSPGRAISIGGGSVTNYSAAARKAWETMPKRKVGRPHGKAVDRVSVMLRIDRELWERFKNHEARGTISDRSGTMEALLRSRLASLEKAAK